MYHINTVDEVIQWEVAVSVEKVTKIYLLPVPEKIRTEQTRIQPHQSNDNVLVEGKYVSVIRRHLGFLQPSSASPNQSTTSSWACSHPNWITTVTTCLLKSGQLEGQAYPVLSIPPLHDPYETPRSLKNMAHHLKPSITLKHLDAISMQCSDNEAAQMVNEAWDILFQLFNSIRNHAA